MSNSYDLADWAAQSGSPTYSLMVEGLYKQGHIAQCFKFRKSNALAMRAFGIEEDGLPTLAFSSLNEDSTLIETKMAPRTGAVSFVRHHLKVDESFISAWQESRVGPDPWTPQVEGFQIAWARKYNNDFINGSTITGGGADAKGFIGLRNMFLNSTAMSKYHIASACKINAGLDISPAGGSSTSIRGTWAKIGELLYEMQNPDGEGVWLLMSESVRSQLTLHSIPDLDTTTDRYDRKITTYRQAKILSVGRGPGLTPVLPGYETTAGIIGTSGSNYHTSIFAIDTRSSALDAIMGGYLDPKDVAQTDVHKKKLINFSCGMLPTSNYWAGQLFNIQITDD